MTSAAPSNRPTVAFLGLGAMGKPMATRVAAAGFPLQVYDIAPGAAKALASNPGCWVSNSVAEAVSGAAFVVLMLPSSKEVESTVNAALGSFAAGAWIVDMSSSEPMRTRELAALLSAKGLSLADAPVSGGVKKALDGSLTIMFGGSDAALAHCTPLLETMGTSLFRTGDVGSGHAMKALNNFVSAAGLIATVEALHIGRKFGLDPATMNRILNASTGKNNTTEKKVEHFMLSGAFNSGFALALMAKDVGIAINLAEKLGVPAQQGKACYELWREAALKATGADHTEMFRLLDARV